MKKSILLGLTFALSFNAHAASSKAVAVNIKQKYVISNEGRGGGDNVALEFQSALISAVAESKSHPQLAKVLADNNILDISAKAHIVIVDDALDVTVRDLVQTSVAVNIPAEQRILINRQRWNDIQDQRIKSAIALHEALSLKNIEQTGYYPYSTKYLTLVGVSLNSLSSALKVNRLQQLQATSGTKDPGVILKKFFEEAREPVTAADLGKEITRLGKSFQCRTFVDNTLKPIELVAVHAYLNYGGGNGPLFPDIRGWRFTLYSKDFPTVTDPNEAAWSHLAVTETSAEVTQTTVKAAKGEGFYFRDHTLRLRKNNGLTTYKISYPDAPEWTSYGYCFADKN